MIKHLHAVLLAAGKSTRLKNGKTKLCEKMCGQELVLYPLKTLDQLHIPITVVVGYQHEKVRETLSQYTTYHPLTIVQQHEMRGTAHAVQCTENTWQYENILIMNGDTPFITPELLSSLYAKHQKYNADVSFIAAHATGNITKSYDHVIKQDTYYKIVDHKVAESKEHRCCVSAGIYIIKANLLGTYIPQLPNHGIHHELYISDIIERASHEKRVIYMMKAPFDTIRGINTYQELWAAEHIKRSTLIKYWMDRGIHFMNAQTTHLDINVTIGSGSFIGSGVHLFNNTIIGNNCTIEPFCILNNATIQDNVTVRSHSVITDSVIAPHAAIGPFAHIRAQSTIGMQSIIGNFVEVKSSTIDVGAKAKHLSYLGDAIIGNNVNIGAGTITCNHDGVHHHKTIIQDRAYIGSNTNLIAPVHIGNDSIIGAGSTITHDVPSESLAIARTRQINKLGYATIIRSRKQTRTQPHTGIKKSSTEHQQTP